MLCILWLGPKRPNMTPELQALTQRVEDLERQVAHLEALAVEHSDTDRTEAARTINAQKFVVTDARGVRRAERGDSTRRDGREPVARPFRRRGERASVSRRRGRTSVA